MERLSLLAHRIPAQLLDSVLPRVNRKVGDQLPVDSVTILRRMRFRSVHGYSKVVQQSQGVSFRIKNAGIVTLVEFLCLRMEKLLIRL